MLLYEINHYIHTYMIDWLIDWSQEMSMSVVHLYSAESCSISTALSVLSNGWTSPSWVVAWSCCWEPGLRDCPVESSRPATEKARRPMVSSRWRGTDRWCRLAERRWCRLAISETGVQQSVMYLGALLCRQQCTVTPVLYWIRSGTSSQCRSLCRSRDRQWSNLCLSLRCTIFRYSTSKYTGCGKIK